MEQLCCLIGCLIGARVLITSRHNNLTKQVKYLNNILEQDHRFIKRITAPMLGFKAFHSAAATVAGIEAAHMIRKGQQFAALAA